jgi:hypothetical protein
MMTKAEVQLSLSPYCMFHSISFFFFSHDWPWLLTVMGELDTVL